MTSINGTAIELIKGDSAYLTFTLKDSRGLPLAFVEGDRLLFAAATSGGRNAVLIREVPLDTLTLRLSPNDTDVLSDTNYKYDLEYRKANGDIETIILGSTLTALKKIEKEGV